MYYILLQLYHFANWIWTQVCRVVCFASHMHTIWSLKIPNLVSKEAFLGFLMEWTNYTCVCNNFNSTSPGSNVGILLKECKVQIIRKIIGNKCNIWANTSIYCHTKMYQALRVEKLIPALGVQVAISYLAVFHVIICLKNVITLIEHATSSLKF